MTDRVALLVDLARRLEACSDPLGQRARADVIADGGLSPEMADRVLVTAARRYTSASLRALVHGALVGRTVYVVLAASVATAPLRAVALPLLGCAQSVRIRPSRRQSALVQSLCAESAWSSVTITDTLTPQSGDLVVAYGSDATLREIQKSLPDGVDFEGHGHGLGIAVVGRSVDADALARDVADHDQRGCLSPQGVYVVGNAADARAVAEALHAAMYTQPPRGRLEAEEAARVMQWHGRMAVGAAGLLRGPQHSVAWFDTPVRANAPGGRAIAVVPVASVAEAMNCVQPDAPWLTCVGIAGLTEPVTLAQGAMPRVVPVGTMQDPAMDGPEDPRTPWGATPR